MKDPKAKTIRERLWRQRIPTAEARDALCT